MNYTVVALLTLVNNGYLPIKGHCFYILTFEEISTFKLCLLTPDWDYNLSNSVMVQYCFSIITYLYALKRNILDPASNHLHFKYHNP